MLFIGERINGMFGDVKKAIADKDKNTIIKLAERQLEDGADYLDINTGPVADGEEVIKWLINSVQEIQGVKICIDSSKPDVLEAGFSVVKNPPIMNSVNAEPENLARLLPLAAKHSALVIALAMDSHGVSATVEEKIECAAFILASAAESGIPNDRIYIDPLILPVGAVQESPGIVLKTLSMIKELDFPAPKTVLGLSNVSQKCSERNLLNRTFLAMALAAGLDAAILDVSDKELMDTAFASGVILNQSIYCDSFLCASRK